MARVGSFRLVTKFADDMLRELEENAHKRGWQDMSLRQLLQRAEQEMGELRRAVESNDGTESSFQEIRTEAADVGNFLGMLVWCACERRNP